MDPETEIMMPHPPLLLSPIDAARVLGVQVETLTDWRQRGDGPPFVRVGAGPRGRVRYRVEALRAWVAGLVEHRSTAEYDAASPPPGLGRGRKPTPEPRQLDLRALVLGGGDGI